MEDILTRLQNQPKINGAHQKDIEDAIKEIENNRQEIARLIAELAQNKEAYIELLIPH